MARNWWRGPSIGRARVRTARCSRLTARQFQRALLRAICSAMLRVPLQGPLKIVDSRMMLDEYEKWNKLYEDIFGSKGR